jgi:hypothetical protein
MSNYLMKSVAIGLVGRVLNLHREEKKWMFSNH